MINTNELMLGNLVSYRGEYVTVQAIQLNQVVIEQKSGYREYALSHDINPIELTDDVLNKLGICKFNWDFLHHWQNGRTLYDPSLGALDITPLLKPKPILTTHDGVEVTSRDAMIWIVYTDATSLYEPKIKDVPCEKRVSDFLTDRYDKQIFVFSSLELAQSYIDQKWAELHPEPIFVTEDGVKIFEGDKYWYVNKNGSNFFDGNTITGFICAKFSGKGDDILHFSSPELCQAYLNKVWAENEYNNLLKAKSEQ